jgi:hypothetical protein
MISDAELEKVAKGQTIDPGQFKQLLSSPSLFRRMLQLREIHGLFQPPEADAELIHEIFEDTESMEFTFSDLIQYYDDQPLHPQKRAEIKDFLARNGEVET